MATDRSTLPRGPYPSAHQQATAPSGRRLPSAPRERKPVLAALALLLVVGGAAVSGLLVVKTSHKVPAIEIAQEVGAGQPIPLSAMREVQVGADSGLSYVAWSERLQVSGYYAAAAIPAGTLLTAKMVVSANRLTSGRQVLGLTLKLGQVPAALRTGDHVDLYDTNTTSQNSCPGLPGATLTRDAIVTSVAFPSSSSGSTNVGVDIALNPRDAGLVACNAANGWAAIGIVPAGGIQSQRPVPPALPGAQKQASSRAGAHKHRVATPTAPVTPATPAGPTPTGSAPPGTG